MKSNFNSEEFIKTSIESIKNKVGNKNVICGLSGGVDSSVAAVLVHRAIGKQLYCVFVDNGLMRKNEADEVETIFSKQFDMNLIRANAQARFLDKLSGISDPEKKRKIIGEEFIRVFEEEAKKLEGINYLVQGTIYSDVAESGKDNTRLVKSHHNVGGLPEDMDFELIEPLRNLYKDQVRELGLALSIPEDLVWRQPFPGPGLGVRVLGEITKDKLNILREADVILREEIKKANLHRQIWQYFAVLPGIQSVGKHKEERTYNYTIAIRAISSTDAMTAQWVKIPYDILEKISERIVNEVEYVNRVVYDITNKPPSTIEWE